MVSNFLQSLGLAKKAIFLSLSRQLLFLLPLLAILPPLLGIEGVWLSMPISDCIAALVAFIMLKRLMNEFNREMAISEGSDTIGIPASQENSVELHKV